MTKLYVLPNGFGVDPDTVTSVRWKKRNLDNDIKDRVIVNLNSVPGALVVDCKTSEEAELACHEIIAGINELRN